MLSDDLERTLVEAKAAIAAEQAELEVQSGAVFSRLRELSRAAEKRQAAHSANNVLLDRMPQSKEKTKFARLLDEAAASAVEAEGSMAEVKRVFADLLRRKEALVSCASALLSCGRAAVADAAAALSEARCSSALGSEGADRSHGCIVRVLSGLDRQARLRRRRRHRELPPRFGCGPRRTAKRRR